MPEKVPHLLFSRASLIGCCAVVFLAVVIGLCGPNSLTCLAVLTSDGAVALLWTAGACAFGAVILRPIFTGTNRPLFTATAGGLGLGLFSLLALGLGLLGWLNRPVAIAFPSISAVLFVLDLVRRHPDPIDRNAIEHWLREPAGSAWLWLIPVISLAIAAVSASIMPGILWKPMDPHPYDVTSYHLLVPREWYEGGRIVPLDHNVFSYFPFVVEMQFLLLMHAMGGPWMAMYACQFLSVGYTVLMVVAVWGAGRGKHSTLNVKRSTFKEAHILSAADAGRGRSPLESWTFALDPALLAAAFVAIVPWTIMLAGVAYVESGLMLYTALSVAWALEAINRPDHLARNLILSGILAGFACGVKITAVPMLLLAVPTAAAVALYFHRPAGTSARRIAIACGTLVLAGSMVLSPWLIRNFCWSGNPLFPIGMSVLGKDHFSAEQVERFRVAHSPTSDEMGIAGKLKVVENDVIAYWQYGYVFLPLAMLALVIRWRDPRSWLLLICALFVTITWFGFTHLLPRFLVMLIPIAAIAIGQLQWSRLWPLGVLLLIGGAVLGGYRFVPVLNAQSNPPLYAGQPRPALMGLVDLPFMLSPELMEARDRHQQIALIGDAQAFLYQIPMSQMHYRTVFNLQGDDPIDAWAGPQVRGDPNWLLVINPMEIDRLHRTYVGVPALPPEWAAHEPEDFYLHGSDFPPESSGK